MKILYIGQYTEGTTSKMRADVIKEVTKPDVFNVIDTHIPFFKTTKLWRSFGFRYKNGLLIKNINRYIITQLLDFNITNYDLIWVDKAVFITKKTTETLSEYTGKLIHFTPDPAFTFHISKHFKKSVSLYNFAITTKLYELDYYEKYLSKEKVLYATQGYNKKLHKPFIPFKDKKEGVIFIGHYEKERASIIKKLLNNGIHVAVAGIKWNNFISQNINYKNLIFLGDSILGTNYAKSLSQYQFSWGSLSKWIPELHTTRTFEIPACGTALITERNSETSSFFKEDEALFYYSTKDMIEKIKHYQNNPDELKILIKKSKKRVLVDGRDYESIITDVISKINI